MGISLQIINMGFRIGRSIKKIGQSEDRPIRCWRRLSSSLPWMLLDSAPRGVSQVPSRRQKSPCLGRSPKQIAIPSALPETIVLRTWTTHVFSGSSFPPQSLPQRPRHLPRPVPRLPPPPPIWVCTPSPLRHRPCRIVPASPSAQPMPLMTSSFPLCIFCRAVKGPHPPHKTLHAQADALHAVVSSTLTGKSSQSALDHVLSQIGCTNFLQS